MKMKKKLPPKRIGEYAEVCFMQRAMSHDLIVSKPYGDSEPYDFNVTRRRRYHPLRIQVRSTSCISGNRYEINIQYSRRRYTRRNVDFIAAYIIPLDIWYIVPVEKLVARMAGFYPHIPNTRALTEQYREAWRLLK